ncbi:hypothetical protein [Kribbella speibonae]|uniref:Uncharacterized protein n=1 Tax=Kribbella speibonae TaxID=1572660 RepID=A0ABY2AE18_9ACTN|nr:hypothetical protein [Kribbella speibonae]TCC26881.1 hypothetical protein E0H58_02405 [Kribbella speibonae]
MTHDLQTCRLPLSAVSAYYHRNLNVGPEPSRPLLRDRDLSIDVGVARPVEIAVVEAAAHSAYLEPRTGTGFLLLPAGETDISSEDGFAGVSWPSEWNDAPAAGLSLQSADLVSLLDRLALSGWTLLEDEHGDAEAAGETPAGRRAVCLFAVRTCHEQLVLEDLQQALTALHAAADLLHHRQ